MRVRKFRKEDAAEVARLHRTTIRTVNSKDYRKGQIYAWSGRTSAKRFRDVVNDKDKVMFVAVEGNRILGFADYKGSDLLGLYVHKDYMERGIGTRLLNHLESYAYRNGVRFLQCEATVTAYEFYKKMGYRTLRKSVHKIKNERLPVYVMRKRLGRITSHS